MLHNASYSFTSGDICLLLSFLLPLLSCIISAMVSERYAWIITITAPLLLSVSAISAAIIFISAPEMHVMHIPWFTIGTSVISADLEVNALSSVMLLVVTVISFLVHFFSTGYMAGDTHNRRYFAMLGFFTFSMLGIVLSTNLLVLFVFWELVGFSSYALIGHWSERPSAAKAATNAFILNRIGDAGFLVGLMIIWANTQTFDLTILLQQTQFFSWQTAAALGIFCGVIGKSAQFPLFTWLPDAMEGPTPVSALIHAATMVAAGVFLLARVFTLFTPAALTVVAITGIITAALAALAALAQTDIKKILAYSTVSQLGLMITTIGAGAADAAMMHLFAHAFFKACLFLSAGILIHILHQAQQQSHLHFDVQDIRNLGGLRKKLPVTFIAFLISGSSLAGIPFFSGFLSKEAMFTALWSWAHDAEETWRWLIVAVAFIISFVTVLYTYRLIRLVFMGEEKSTQELTLGKTPFVMQVPVIFLATASLWFILSLHPLAYEGWLYHILHAGKTFHFNFMVPASAAWVFLALLTGWLLYRSGKIRSITVLKNAFFLDSIYRQGVEKTILRLGSIAQSIDLKWIDGIIHIAAYLQVALAYSIGWFDRYVVDGSVNGVGYVSKKIGSFTRSFQSGKIQLYIYWAIFGLIIFLIWTLL